MKENKDSFSIKVGLAEMLKGGVIMDVTNVKQAKIAEDAGAVAVMALERIPSDIRKDGGVARMSNPRMIKEIQSSVTIPVMAKCRIGHTLEAKILEALKVDFIDESEVLTPADNESHVDKKDFKVPFVCGARNLGEALRRVDEGAAMIRTKGEAGSGNIVEAVMHMKKITSEIELVSNFSDNELKEYANQERLSMDNLIKTVKSKHIPVPNFSAGGIATPADAALMMYLGAESVFVGSGIFKSDDPENRAKAIVDATTYHDDPKKLAEISMKLKTAMKGLEISEIPEKELLQNRGW